jgi:hypothetical protein
MAPTESTPPSSPNQSLFEPKSSKGDDKPEEAQPETDPSTTEHLQSTVGGSDELTDPSTEKHLREAT